MTDQRQSPLIPQPMAGVTPDQFARKPPFRIGNLGEIAIRCRDYAAMQHF